MLGLNEAAEQDRPAARVDERHGVVLLDDAGEARLFAAHDDRASGKRMPPDIAAGVHVVEPADLAAARVVLAEE